MRETDLYAPVKALFESRGYDVKAEVNGCDLVALKGEDAPVVVELKLSLSIGLLMQGVDRQSFSDAVYIAIPRGKGPRWKATLRDGVKLCRRLGLGLMTVRLSRAPHVVEVLADPLPYRPRKNVKRRHQLLREFSRRVGDPNVGGQNGRPLVTAYRQDALRLARFLTSEGPSRPAEMARALEVPKAGPILRDNHYGWFERVERGVYRVTEAGREALETYAETLAMM